MPSLVNKQHEAFCREYFGNKNGKDAAIAAGYAPQAARSMASRLLTKGNIIARLRELKEKAASRKIMSVKERMERLSVFGRENVKSDKGVLVRTGNLGAIDTLNKMGGDYPPSKIEIAGQGGGPIQVEDARVKLTEILDEISKRMEPKSEAEADKTT